MSLIKKKLHNKKIPLVILICIIETIVILYMLYSIYIQRKIFGISINPIDSKNVILNPDKNLKNFYELRANTTIEFDNHELNTKPVIIKTNADGLNESLNYSAVKPPGTYRIITLGDSFTFGWYVDTSENYPEKLEQLLNSSECSRTGKFEVINFGVGGYDIEYAYHRFEKTGKKYNPDMIIWLIQDADFLEISDFVTHYGDLKLQELSDAGKLDDYVNQGITGNPGRFEAKKALQDKWGLERIVKYQKEKLYSISNVFQGKLVLVTFTDTNSKLQDILRNLTLKRPDTYFINSIPRLKIPTEAFPDTHPTSAGYSKIANQIYNYLHSDRIIPCN